MPKPFSPKVVTANDLLEGDAIWLTASGGWTREMAQAEIATTPEEAEALLTTGAAQAGRIVGAYLADATIDDDGVPHPAHFREAFRTRGPSNRFHGKQAQAGSAV